MATLTLVWKDINLNEDGFNIYRSESPMDTDNMPEPIATLDPNIGSYDDTTGTVGTVYYYRIGVFRGSNEIISDELTRVFDNTVNTHDIFGDGSAVATYNFDGDATDLGGNYNGTWDGNENYDAGLIDQAAFLNGSSYIDTGYSHTSENSAISLWVKSDSPDFTSLFVSRTLILTNEKIDVFLNNSGTGDTERYTLPEIPIERWFHLVVSLDNNVATVYYDSVEQSITSTSASYSSTRRDNTTFGYDGASGYWAGGMIDQIRIFDRPLTQSEISSLYNEVVL